MQRLRRDRYHVFRHAHWYAGLAFAAVVVALGTAWALQRGGHDFSVFRNAGALALQGRARDIFHATPDRFLYAPGFAWVMAPFAALPHGISLALWCFAKAAVIGLLLRMFALRLSSGEGGSRIAAFGISAWAILFFAKPLLIDFQYGQVNTFIMVSCVWALLSRHDHGDGSRMDFLRWFALGVAAVVKIFPLPLLLVPLLLSEGVPRRRLRLERIGLVAGILFILVLPFIFEGPDGGIRLYMGWKAALLDRGAPFESHNQSFTALINRLFSGNPVHVISLGADHVPMSLAKVDARLLALLSVIWTVVSIAALLLWIAAGPVRAVVRGMALWAAVACGLLIVPSHLVWKPYFVMGIPVAYAALTGLMSMDFSRARARVLAAVLAVAFVMVNFSGFDFVGYRVAAWLEVFSVMMLAHLAVLVVAVMVHGKKNL